MTSSSHVVDNLLLTIHDVYTILYYSQKVKLLIFMTSQPHKIDRFSTSILSLSGACQPCTDVAASMSCRNVDLSKARRLAVARLKLSRRSLSSSVLSQVCFGLPVLHRQSLARSRMQWMHAWRTREWSWLVSVPLRQRWPTKDRRRRRIVSDRSDWPVRDRTTSLETESVQPSSEYREYVCIGLRHQLSNASIFFARVEVIQHTGILSSKITTK